MLLTLICGGKRVEMKALLTSVLIALGLVCVGCGGTSNKTDAASGKRSATVSVPYHASRPTAALIPTTSIKSLEQDEDDDDGPGEEKGLDSKDSDIDGDNDHLKPLGYYDHDDGAMRDYGHAASGVDKRELTAFARRYYAAAAAGDGATACSMFSPVFAKSIPQDYGRGSAGPSFLREATTCPAVLALVFSNLRARFSAPIEIIRVRVKGNEGRILISAKNMPASYLELHREDGVWRSTSMFASRLP